ncbi:olfactory receptor 6C3-like [Tachyglossus aculeatus]|uniref:olfactory receptor 6C3-like n=1 Tax=Tachyglossus aculeatus TaxID=9261 RepID=UPI0018F2F871|nr:olfactory receptor 6C3-like [Tachyglossus aculeatus]
MHQLAEFPRVLDEFWGKPAGSSPLEDRSSQREQATMGNGTGVTEFIFVGLTDDPQLQAPLFFVLFLTYALSVTGNLTHRHPHLLDSHLRTPHSAGPLHYKTVMSGGFCALLVLCCGLAGFLVVFPPVIILLHHDFCSSNIINHFICDSSPMLQLSCSDTRFLELMAFLLALGTLLVTLALVTASYTAIIRAILRLPSAQQRRKAFSTCSSHVIVVSITYGSCIFMYIKPSAKARVELTKVVAVLNTSIAPMLNPFIYTLRNEQVKQALRALVQRIVFSSRKWLPKLMEYHSSLIFHTCQTTTLCRYKTLLKYHFLQEF